MKKGKQGAEDEFTGSTEHTAAGGCQDYGGAAFDTGGGGIGENPGAHPADGLAGGGSILDCAKISSCMAAMDTNIRYFLENKLEINKNIPVIALPTTSGTGSEVTSVSVISDTLLDWDQIKR